jgi:hypothetical protein
MYRFGIDAASPTHQGLIPQVAAAFTAPAFVGRYGPVYAITAEEAAWLHQQRIAILAIWNESQDGSALGGTIPDGVAAAGRAVAFWRGMGTPAGTAIYIDVEASFWISGEYLTGWVQGCHAAGFVGGCYINSIGGNSHNAAYQWMRERVAADVPSLIYASEPEPYALKDTVAQEWQASAPAGFERDVAVWQYWEGSLDGQIDLDMCNDLGWAHLWHAEPLPRAVAIAGALKTEPNDTSRAAIDPRRRPVHLAVGEVVNPTGAARSGYTELRLPHSPVHGWYPTQYLK